MQLIGLTGLNASGKGTVAEYLKEKGFKYYSLSDIVREYATEKGLDHSRENLIICGNELREKYGPSVLAKRIVQKLKKDRPSKAVIDSIRNISEIRELRTLEDFVLVCVQAPVEVRFERSKKRGRIGFETNLQDFIDVEQKENSDDPAKQQLFKCQKLADKIIANDGTVKDLKKKAEKILSTSRR